MREFLGGVIAVLALIAIGLAIVYAGVYDIGASTPHSAFGRWLFDTTLRNSVEARAGSINVPPLADPARMGRGAKEFDEHCVVCHGAPGVKPGGFSEHMRPKPPELRDAAEELTSAELYWIVTHGIKMTGMPAWGALLAEDERWDVVAFIGALPKITPAEYQQLARAGANAKREKQEKK